MKYLTVLFILVATTASISSCKKCQNCELYENPFVGGRVIEEREVCDESVADELEATNMVNRSWSCE
ncbi:MAG: hypothetical protein ACPGU4_02215 [Flavobacteriales bacterium]